MRTRLAFAAAALAVAGGVPALTATTSGTGPPPAVVVADVGGRIVAANVDGSGSRALTHPNPVKLELDESPVPSPDGSLIAFARNGEDERVMVMRADGSGLRTLAAATLLDAQWSPDGSRLALETMPPFKLPTGAGSHFIELSSGISLVAPDGSSSKTIVDRSEHSAVGFSWSPDGGSLAYTGKDTIKVVDLRTGARRVVVAMAGAWRPAWSPDGTRIAFMNDWDVYVVSAAGGTARRLGKSGQAETPVWSPDSSRLAFTSSPYPHPTQVTVVDVASGRVAFRIPSSNASASAAPVWSPDGSKLAFLRARTPGDFADVDADVWVAAADGSRIQQVTSVFPFGGAHSPAQWLTGVDAVAPDVAPPAARLRPLAPKNLTGECRLAAVDGTVAAIVPTSDTGGGLGIWRSGGQVAWIKGVPADRAAIRGNRVYWSWYGSDRSESRTELWTSLWPKGRRVRLAAHTGDPGAPALLAAGDRSLVVYAYAGALWRLDGTRATLIRRERTKLLEPLAVDNGRVLLWNTRALELVNGQGKLLATLSPGKDPVAAALSGPRVIVLDRTRIIVRRLTNGTVAATWPVGAPGRAGRAGIPHGSLFPYTTENGYGAANSHLLDVASGRDTILALQQGMSPTSVAVSRSGLFYTATPPYRGIKAQIGFVPQTRLAAALAGP